jgi:peptidyl-prolyl cis-trans isomerase D
MLQNIRDNSKGIISKVLVSLIAFTFVIWGAESLFSFSTDNSAPAEVNGEEISLQELLQTAELQRRQILSNNPDIDPVTLDQQAIQATALQQLISQRVMLQYTQSNDLAISEAAVDQMIVQSKDFQVDGEFDRELFESLLRNFGLTPTTYRQQLKRGNLVGQVQQAVAGSAFTLEPNADLVASLDGQTRNIAVLTLPLALEMLNVSIDEQDIDTYYVDNKQRFMTPENVSVSFVMLNKSHFYDLVEVTDEDLKNAYLDAQQTALQKSEVEASHLLFLVNDSQTEEQALALAGVAFNQLELGQDFTEVAQQHSQDDSTSSDGGYIGLLAKGEFGEAFDKVLFDLQPGTYSAPVTTEFGVQIVYAHDDAAGQPTFEEQKDALNLALKQSGAESLFVAASEEMADIAFSSPDLLEVAEALGLSVETSSPFGRQGGEDIASYDRVVAAAFADDVLLQGNNSSVLELASDKLVVIRVNQHNEPSQQPIADVKVDIVEQLVAQKSSAALDIKAKAYVEELNSGADMGSVATTENLTWQQFNNLVRGSTVVNSLLVQSAFRLPRVVSGGVSYGIAPSFTGDVSIIQLQSVTDANPEEQTPEQRLSLIEALTRMQGQGDVKLLESSLSGQAVVETF